MKKKLLVIVAIMAMLIAVFAITASAEAVYVNANGEQVEAGSSDIAYELEIQNPFEKGGNCRVKYIYLYDTSIKKIIIPAFELTHSNGTVYKAAEYDYIRLSTGWDGTLSIYTLDDRDTKTTSLHAQMTELEFHIPILADGASGKGNLAGWSSLEKISYYSRAYEPQDKGGFLSGCTSLKEVHFYGQNNLLSGNFFCSTIEKVVFHEGATGTIRNCALQSLNGTTVTTVVYMNDTMQPQDATDPRLTWNKNTAGLSFVYLVSKTIGVYDDAQIESYAMPWLGGNNKSDSNPAWTASIMTYCQFYNQHEIADDDHMCTTGATCSKCLVSEAGKTHEVTITWTYENGYSAEGTKVITCKNEKGCLVGTAGIDKEGTTKTPALVVGLGYSTRLNGKGGLKAGYNVNNTLIEEYVAYTGVDIQIGLLIADAASLSDTILTAEGELAVAGINVKSINLNYTSLNISLDGFTVSSAKDLELAMMLYVVEGGQYKYVQSPHDSTAYQSKTVSGVEVEYVTFEQVAKAKGFTSLDLADGTLQIQ